MGKWFFQAREIERLRQENRRLTALIEQMKFAENRPPETSGLDMLTTTERSLIAQGKRIEAIKRYRERTGTDLRTAKNVIMSHTL